MRTIALVTLAVLLAGCGGSASNAPTAAPTAGATGPGIAVHEALASTLPGPLLVNGSLIARGKDVRLCESISVSFPPECGEPHLVVRGLDLSSVRGLKRRGSVAWADQVQLLGDVSGQVLTLSRTATA